MPFNCIHKICYFKVSIFKGFNFEYNLCNPIALSAIVSGDIYQREIRSGLF